MARVDATGTLLVGRYLIGKRVGGGGMGAVHQARDQRVGRTVAVKVLHPQLAKEEQHVARFLREAKAAAALQHPHIVQVLDVSADESDTPFLVMELLEGQSLSQIIRDEKRLLPGRVTRLARQLLAALGAAHAAGIVHRDMKPGNIIVLRGYDGREITKIVDFGIAKLINTESYTRLTATGEILGTPAYMAPEQLTGGKIDGRTDLYGVGAIMYAAIAGEVVVGRGSLPEIAHRALTGEHPALSDSVQIHPGLEAAIERALAVDPNDRYFEPAQMFDALAPFEDPTGAVVVPEHRADPRPETRPSRPTRADSASPRSARGSGASEMHGTPVPTTSERPPASEDRGPRVPATSERPRAMGGSGHRVPVTSERPPPEGPPAQKATLPEGGPESVWPKPSVASPGPVPARAPRPASAGKASRKKSPRKPSHSAPEPRRGWMLAVLAFGGAVLGAVVVTAVVLLTSREEAPATQPLAPIPVLVPIPAPSTSIVEPMLPSGVQVPVVEEVAEVPDAAADADAAAESEPQRRRRRRRRRRRPREQMVDEPSDGPIYTITPDMVGPLPMGGAGGPVFVDPP